MYRELGCCGFVSMFLLLPIGVAVFYGVSVAAKLYIDVVVYVMVGCVGMVTIILCERGFRVVGGTYLVVAYVVVVALRGQYHSPSLVLIICAGIAVGMAFLAIMMSFREQRPIVLYTNSNPLTSDLIDQRKSDPSVSVPTTSDPVLPSYLPDTNGVETMSEHIIVIQPPTLTEGTTYG